MTHSIRRTWYQEIISKTAEVNPTEEERLTAKRTNYNQIIEGLYLGNGAAFNEALWGSQECLNFATVITACPLSSVFTDWGQQNDPEKYIFSIVGKRPFDWYYVGRGTFDDESFWPALVHDATFLDSELSKRIILHDKSNAKAIRNEKATAILNLPVDEWFEPIFDSIDKAVFENKLVLVHCVAGISRSATIIAAYLIKRFGVTPSQAINYLKSKRLCVNPAFAKPLETYAASLKLI